MALDFSTADAALACAARLAPRSCRLKIGKELFTAAGPALVEKLVRRGFDIFLDLKFHDIPNTVAGACKAAAHLGVWMLNVHALGGRAMLAAAREAVAGSARRPHLIAVTLLTSMGTADMQDVGIAGDPAAAVLRLAKLAQATGLEVHIENGPIACALAQMWLGKRGDEGNGDFTYLSVFDGVGAGIVVNGQILRGHGDTAGEFGHIPLEPEGPRCLCGARGCLEAHTSNLATLARYLGLELAAPDTRARLVQSGLTVGDLITRARTGDARAMAAVRETGAWLGVGASMIVNVLNPSRIFVGGEITGAWDIIDPLLRHEVATRALTRAAAATPLVPQPFAPNPRLRGAIALVAAPMFAAPQVA